MAVHITTSNETVTSLPWRFGPIRAAGCRCNSPLCQRLHQRITEDLSRRSFVGGVAAMLAPFALPSLANAQDLKEGPRPVLLTNLRLFDGSGNSVREGAQVLDCQGKLLMPGLIDVHWHTMLAGISQLAAVSADLGYLYLVAAKEAQRTLMRGFTSVREPSGPAFALKRAIDEGIVDGPRIFPSGAMISQTSGHGDVRLRSDLPRAPNAPLSLVESSGIAMIADGEAEVMRRVRGQLMLGASQIKMLAGGGVASMYDPLDSTQFSESELRAGVEVASDWNTYVMAHVYTPKGIQRSIRAGVKCIEHGQLADEASVRMMRDEGVWWSLQPFLQDEDSNVYPDPARRASQKQVAEGTVQAYALAQKYGIKTGWGTDMLFNPKNTGSQGRQLAKLTRFYDPLKLLGQATGINGDLLALSGARNPYPGVVGRIAPKAWADLLVVDGNPSTGLDFLADPEKNLNLVMKDGKIYKNTL